MLYAALHNKISQKLWLDKIRPEVSPPVTHYVAGNRVVTVDDRAMEITERSQVPTLLESGRAIFIKPADSGKGAGAYQVEREEVGFRVNGQYLDRSGLEDQIAALPLDFMISDIIDQSAWARRLFPGAVNTVRVMTATSSVDYRVVVLAAVLKCGTSRSAPTDNFLVAQGGTISSVDLDSGVLGPCVSFDEAKFARITSDRHPETGTLVAGETLPHWPLIHKTVAELSGILPRPGLVGWDIALREEGITVVEMNTLPGIDAVQSASPLLDTEAKRDILAEFRMV